MYLFIYYYLFIYCLFIYIIPLNILTEWRVETIQNLWLPSMNGGTGRKLITSFYVYIGGRLVNL